MQDGYIKLYRKVLRNRVLQERGKRFSRLEAWIFLCLKANGMDGELGLKRGDLEASERFLAKAWNWSKSAVHRFIDNLIESSMLIRLDRSQDRSQDRWADRFSICNYGLYNPVRTAHRTAHRTAGRTKVKEGINKEEIKQASQAAGAAAVESLPSVQSFQLSEQLRRAIATRDPNARAAKVPDTTGWARDIDKLIRIDGRRVEDIEAVIAWCQKSPFWGPNILSGRKLREKFDTLFGQWQGGEVEDVNKRGYKPDTVGLQRKSPKTKARDFVVATAGGEAPSKNPKGD